MTGATLLSTGIMVGRLAEAMTGLFPGLEGRTQMNLQGHKTLPILAFQPKKGFMSSILQLFKLVDILSAIAADFVV